jgi:signal transduction histidine kinase
LIAIFILICLIFEFFLIFETESSLGFFYPSDNTDLINYYVHFSSPLGIIVIIYYVSLFFFLGIGFLYQSVKSKGLIRKKFLYLGIAEMIFIPTSILELLPISSFYFLISRPVLIIVPILIFLGFKEESIVKENNLIVEQNLFRLVENSFEEFKSSFLRRASHELKTPLIPIKGNLDYLLNENADKLEEDVIFRLNEIKHGYNVLETVIQNFLFSLELEGDGIELNKRKIDLANIIRNQVKVYKDLINLRNHKLSLDIPDSILVPADKVRMERVIDNLLINAIKFTPSGGNIKISSTIERFHVMISVEDDGIGIIEKDKSKLFQKFGKIERYGQGWDIISEGSGLGLFICKKIIHQHDGEIWMSSEGKNKGTQVSFKIPVF